MEVESICKMLYWPGHVQDYVLCVVPEASISFRCTCRRQLI